MLNSVVFHQKYTQGPANPIDAIDRARRKASRNLLAASAQRRLGTACLAEKVVSRLFQHQLERFNIENV
jgi:hypothetical protein